MKGYLCLLFEPHEGNICTTVASRERKKERIKAKRTKETMSVLDRHFLSIVYIIKKREFRKTFIS